MPDLINGYASKGYGDPQGLAVARESVKAAGAALAAGSIQEAKAHWEAAMDYVGSMGTEAAAVLRGRIGGAKRKAVKKAK